LICLQVGPRAGEVHDVLPHEARAMLADGRARRVPDGEPEQTPVAVPVPSQQLVWRTDRVHPPAKRRARR
jgi:hypothetical protein